MAELAELAQELASAVVMVTHDDLPALAAIHTQLQDLREALPEEMPDNALARETSADCERLIEQIVLREVDDAEAAVRKLSETVCNLICMVAPEEQSAVSGVVTSSDGSARSSREEPVPTVTLAGESQEDALNPADVPLVSEFIAEATAHIASAEAALLVLETNGDDPEAVNTIFRGFHTIKGVAGFLNLKSINDLAHAAETLLERARHGTLRLEDAATDVVLDSIDLMKRMIAALSQRVSDGSAPKRPDELDGLIQRLTACATGKKMPAPDPKATNIDGARSDATKPEPSVAHANPPAESFVKVSTERLDSLINAIGELVIAQSMVRQDIADLAASDHRVGRNFNHLGKIARELQDLSMSMRMVPIQGVFQKMTRVVRDVARKSGKEIELVLVGGETELDRNLVEAVSDPLIHMVRNAADHGIESPRERENAGKPRMGRIQLKAHHAAGHIVVEVSDDGKGLVKGKILKKAIQAGLILAGEQLNEQDIFKLIFHAGLSTADQVTDISGRGVGMDVVRENVEALRGRVDIASVEGAGSTFTIRLPLTLAVIDGLLVKVGAARFILPILSVEQSVRPTADQLSTIQGRGEMCMVRDSLLPLYRLHRLLNVGRAIENPTEGLVVIVQDDARRCCLLIDELLGQQQVVIKSLGEGIGHVRGISGGAILGDGHVSLILDVPSLIDLASGQ